MKVKNKFYEMKVRSIEEFNHYLNQLPNAEHRNRLLAIYAAFSISGGNEDYLDAVLEWADTLSPNSGKSMERQQEIKSTWRGCENNDDEEFLLRSKSISGVKTLQKVLMENMDEEDFDLFDKKSLNKMSLKERGKPITQVKSIPVEWWIPGLLAKGSTNLVGGLPKKAGKTTWWVSVLSELLDTGTAFGRFGMIPENVWLFSEADDYSIAPVLYKINVSEKMFIIYDDLDDDYQMEQILVDIKNELGENDIVIIDTKANFDNEVKDDNGYMQTYRSTKKIVKARKATGATFIFTCHAGKYSDKDKELSISNILGSVGNQAGLDNNFVMKRTGSMTEIKGIGRHIDNVHIYTELMSDGYFKELDKDNILIKDTIDITTAWNSENNPKTIKELLEDLGMEESQSKTLERILENNENITFSGGGRGRVKKYYLKNTEVI